MPQVLWIPWKCLIWKETIFQFLTCGKIGKQLWHLHATLGDFIIFTTQIKLLCVVTRVYQLLNNNLCSFLSINLQVRVVPQKSWLSCIQEGEVFCRCYFSFLLFFCQLFYVLISFHLNEDSFDYCQKFGRCFWYLVLEVYFGSWFWVYSIH